MIRKLKPTLAALGLLVIAQTPIPLLAIADGPAQAPPCPCHASQPEMKRATRTTASYVVPPVKMVRDDGKMVSLPAEIDDGRPVVLNFIFTSCTTICPVMSSTLAGLQSRLGKGARVHLVSISIDPEQDTPARLVDYAHRYHAGPAWQHYTGTVEASVAVQRAFDAYRGDKMSHTAVTFLRAAPGKPWVRIDGYPSPEELAREFRELVASR